MTSSQANFSTCGAVFACVLPIALAALVEDIQEEQAALSCIDPVVRYVPDQVGVTTARVLRLEPSDLGVCSGQIDWLKASGTAMSWS